MSNALKLTFWYADDPAALPMPDMAGVAFLGVFTFACE